MMRKGDLADYPPEGVLRAAAEEGLDGGIDFDVDRRISVYLTGGSIYLVLADGDPDEVEIDQDLDDHAFAAAVEATEHRLLPHAVDLLAELLEHSTGEYFHHPLNEHPLMGEWDWDTVDLLDEVARRRAAAEEAAAAERAEVERAEVERAEAERAEAEQEEALRSGPDGDASSDDGGVEAADATSVEATSGEAAPVEGTTSVDPPEVITAADVAAAAGGAPDGPGSAPSPSWGDDSLVRLTGALPSDEVSADGWALIAAMADAIPVAILASRLGWPTDRLAAALESLRDAGAVAEDTFGAPDVAPPASALG